MANVCAINCVCLRTSDGLLSHLFFQFCASDFILVSHFHMHAFILTLILLEDEDAGCLESEYKKTKTVFLSPCFVYLFMRKIEMSEFDM